MMLWSLLPLFTGSLQQRCTLNQNRPTYDQQNSTGCLYMLLKIVFPLQKFLAEAYLKSHRLLSEVRSLFSRMQISPDKYGWLIRIGPMRGKNEAETLAFDMCLRARTEGIQEMRANWPYATPVDVQIFLEGWQKGEAWALVRDNTLNYDNTNSGVGSSYLPFYPKEYWKLKPVKQFMRLSFAPVWSAIQSLLQLTKRDLQSPLP
jgi:hypothetical protein